MLDRALTFQLAQKAVPICYVRRLQLLELRQQRPSLRGVVPIAFQLCNDLALTSDVRCTECYVLLSEGQVFLRLLSIHQKMLPEVLGKRRGHQPLPGRAASSMRRWQGGHEPV
jgi:hypothetical protein